MNKGLKSYTKQLTQTVGNAGEMSVNINKTDANAHIVLPLLSSVGAGVIDTSLVFNYQDRAKSGMFGNGVKLNLYNKVYKNGSTICFENADGSIDEYLSADGFKNKETQKTVSERFEGDYLVNSRYFVTDKAGNTTEFVSYLPEYPQKIRTKSGETYTLDFVSATKTVSNGRGDQIRFIKESGSFVTRVAYYRNNVEIAYVKLAYTNAKLSSLTYMKGSAVLAKTSLSYTDTEVMLKDEMSGQCAKCTFVDGKATQIKEGYGAQITGGQTVSITYDGNEKTCLQDDTGKTSYVFFDKDGLPMFEMNSDGQVVKTVYDRETKAVVAQSPLIETQNKPTNLLPSEHVGSYTLDSNLTRTKVSVTDEFFGGILGDSVYKITASGNQNQMKSATCVLSKGGIATDSVMAIIWGKQLTAKTNSSGVAAKLTVGGETSQCVFSKEKVDNNFDLIVLGVNAKKTYSNITLQFDFYGNSSIELGGIQIVKKELGAFYTYDEAGNIEEAVQGANAESWAYDDENRPIENVGADGTEYTYEYDNYGNVKTVWGAYGVKLENEYATNVKTNLTQKTVSTLSGDKKLVTKREYDAAGRFVTKEIDESGNATTYAYNSLGNVTKITNALRVVTDLEYENDAVLKKLLLQGEEGKEMSAQYEYDEKQRVKTITLANGGIYEFVYDECNNITQIKLNGQTAYSYTYDADGSLTKQTYGNGDEYTFEYADKLISKVYFKHATDSANTLKYEYTYNAKKQLQSVKDGANNVLSAFEYDDNGRLVKQSNNDYSVKKVYDNLGNVATQANTVDNFGVYQSFDPKTHSRLCNTKSIFKNFTGGSYVGDFSRNAKLIFGDTLLAPVTHDGKEQHNVQYAKENDLRYVKVDANHLLSYKPQDETYSEFECGNVEFWFRPNGNAAEQVIFSCRGSDEKSYIEVALHQGGLFLSVTDIKGTVTSPMHSDNTMAVNEWNFFALDFHNRDDGLGDGGECIYRLTLNDQTKTYRKTNPRLNVDVGGNPVYNIGHGYAGGNVIDAFEGDIACVRIFPRNCTTAAEVQRFYNFSNSYINGTLAVEDDPVSDFSQTNLYALSQSNFSNYEVYPLQKHLLSLNGNKPAAFDAKRFPKCNEYRPKTFEFNEKTQRYAYIADGEKLAYSFGHKNQSTIVMRAYTDRSLSRQQLFECKDTYGNLVGLYKGNNDYLYFDFKGYLAYTNLKFTTGEWHTVAVSFKEEVATNSGGDLIIPLAFTDPIENGWNKKVRVMLDGQMYENTFWHSYAPTTFTTMIGRKTADGSLVSDRCPFYGHIEMLAASASYITQTEFNTLADELNCVTKTSEYDDFGMFKGSHIHIGGESILKQEVEYKSQTKTENGKTYKQLSHVVSKDKITAWGEQPMERAYTTDALGRVTGITDSVFGNHTYTYDNRGFLTSADDETYEYDANGNITKLGDTVLTYGGVMKDRLTSVNGKEITYANDSSINPTSWDGTTFTFEGRRLVGVGQNAAGKNISFEYDDRGLRTRKIVTDTDASSASTSVETKYCYDGDKLITEKQGANTRLDYLYDENGSLYGFVYNKNAKYFYVRDSLENILGIIDSNGTLVVQYKYSAYGEVLEMTGTETAVGIRNPFRYKGYYYDTETAMYYCQSRHYVPSWGRWLNADHPSYLEPCKLNSINLFSYCGNDPIDYLDYSGNIAIVLIAFTGLSLISFLTLFAIVETETRVLSNAVSNFFENISDLFTFKPNLGYIENNDTLYLIDIDIFFSRNPDPFGRAGQKKQGRELKTKARRKDNWQDRSGRRGGPKPLKKHTPGRDHRKYMMLALRELYELFEEFYLDRF